MKILVSGSGGMVGSALLPVLRSAGHQVTRLVRRPSAPLGPEDSTVQWNPETGEIDSSRLEGIEAAGAPGGREHRRPALDDGAESQDP